MTVSTIRDLNRPLVAVINDIMGHFESEFENAKSAVELEANENNCAVFEQCYTFPNGFSVYNLTENEKKLLIDAVRETIYEQLKEYSHQRTAES